MIRWMESKTCSHSNDEVCPTCDFDDYYARTNEDCPWRDDLNEDIQTVLDQLDGTEATAVSLITGLSLDDLGGV